MAIFRFYKMVAAAILNFYIFEILTVGTYKRAKLRHHAKFRRNRSNRGRDMVIFRFSKMAAAAILDFQHFKFLRIGRLRRDELLRRAKFVRNRSNFCGDMMIFRFFQDGGRRPPWICCVSDWTTHKRPLAVFITVQNLVGIDAVVFYNMQVLVFCDFGLKTPIHAPF